MKERKKKERKQERKKERKFRDPVSYRNRIIIVM